MHCVRLHQSEQEQATIQQMNTAYENLPILISSEENEELLLVSAVHYSPYSSVFIYLAIAFWSSCLGNCNLSVQQSPFRMCFDSSSISGTYHVFFCSNSTYLTLTLFYLTLPYLTLLVVGKKRPLGLWVPLTPSKILFRKGRDLMRKGRDLTRN